jgi:hypothetical protein
MIIEKKQTNKKAIILVLLVVLSALLAVGLFRYVGVLRQDSQREGAVENRVKATEDAFNASHLRNSPTALQDLFLSDVRNGVNDKVTKSAIYFITHRFFDNGGNVYEIYDYIEAHPELSFLKEAEKIYPKWFGQLKRGEIPRTHTDRSLYIYLAYVEVLEKHGYTDVAAVATAANQYVKTAYFNTTIAKEMPKKEGQYRSYFAKRDKKKGTEFLKRASQDVAAIMDGRITEKDIAPRDILVGLNQYAAALRYLEAMKADISASPRSAGEIFEFTTEYAYRNVPALHHFTSLLNASTLAILDGADPRDVRTALYPILDFDMKDRVLADSILHKVIQSRTEPKLPVERVGETNMDIYSKRNTLRLARIVPEFKAWLMSNGWVESDFQ